MRLKLKINARRWFYHVYVDNDEMLSHDTEVSNGRNPGNEIRNKWSWRNDDGKSWKGKARMPWGRREAEAELSVHGHEHHPFIGVSGGLLTSTVIDARVALRDRLRSILSDSVNYPLWKEILRSKASLIYIMKHEKKKIVDFLKNKVRLSRRYV